LTFDNGFFYFNSTPIQTHLISIFDEEKYGKSKFTLEEIEKFSKLSRA